jgi:glucokinase
MYIIADIGGTNTRIAGTRDLESFGTPIIFDTPQEYDAALEKIMSVAQELTDGQRIERAVFGLPARLTNDGRSIVGAKHLPAWKGKSFADNIENALGTTVILENDTSIVGLGEAVYGIGVGVASVMYLTVSTGVNAAHIVNGTINTSYQGVSTGRQYVSMDNPITTWENMISGTAIKKKYGKHPRDLGKDWTGWEELARIVAFGVHNTIMHWTPELIILGGSMFNEIGISVERVRFHVEEINSGIPNVPEIVHSQLGDLGGLWGGMARLKQLIS